MSLPATKRVLIFGISGQDDALLARLRLTKGYEVFGTSRDAETQSFANLQRLGFHDQVTRVQVTRVSVSLLNFRSVLQAIARVRPDEIYNLAGQSSVGLCFDQPVETFDSISVATLNLIEAIRIHDSAIRLYNACSSECFGNSLLPADENTPMRPRSPYAVAQAAAIWQVANLRQGYGLYCATGRLFNHESPLRPERFVVQKSALTARRIADGSNKKLELGDLSAIRAGAGRPNMSKRCGACCSSPRRRIFSSPPEAPVPWKRWWQKSSASAASTGGSMSRTTRYFPVLPIARKVAPIRAELLKFLACERASACRESCIA